MGFKFGNNVVKLEIEGRIFRTRISQKMLEDMKAFAEKAKEMQLGIIGCTDTDIENKIIDFMDSAIDRDAVIIAFCAAELISICETAGLMGILPKPVQQILVKAIDILSKKSEEG